MDGPRFVIEASEAESMAKQSGLTIPLLLPSLVKSAQSLARPPISKYHVGAVVRSAAEIKILVSSIEESDSKSNDYVPLPQFLPHRFGPYDLLNKDVPLLLEPRFNGLSLSDESAENHTLCNGAHGSDWEKLKRAALDAANMSHAPYSRCPSGVALIDTDGQIYKGSYMESAAYNPSMGPVQTAIVSYVAGGGGGYERIVAAVLVEKDGVDVKQEHTARLLLQTISPECEFRVVHCVAAV
ncbi:Cytidine deaminase 1, partial [Cucurbita argyrosperma subsp. argyrosperma]